MAPHPSNTQVAGPSHLMPSTTSVFTVKHASGHPSKFQNPVSMAPDRLGLPRPEILG